MDIDMIVQVGTAATVAGAGFVAGRRGVARQTVELLQIQVDALKHSEQAKTEQVVALQGKVEVLEQMVTQKAAVEEVRVSVDEVKATVGRIAAKVGA